MEYKKLTKEFRDLFFKLNSIKNMPEEDSTKLAFCGVRSASDEFNRRIEQDAICYGVGSKILFIKVNREMVTTKSGNRFFKVKSYTYNTATVIEKGVDRLKLEHEKGKVFSYKYSTVFEVGCWVKNN